MTYFTIKKQFRFLINDYNFKIKYKQVFGFIYVTYINEKYRITIKYEDGYAKIVVSDANSLGTFYDCKYYFDEFKIEKHSFKARTIAAANWLKEQMKNDVKLC